MTQKEFHEKCNGYHLREAKVWEHTRHLCMFIINSMSTKPVWDPKKIMRIPLIDGKDAPEMSKEEIRAMFERLTPK